LGDAERAYAINKTLFLFSEYFGWVEILRRETEFLNLADSEYDRSLATALLAIDVIMSGGDDRENLDFRVYRGQQRAIGELMTTRRSAEADQPTCLGYARFIKRLHDDPEFSFWLSPLEEDIHRMAVGEDVSTQRLRDLQAALVNLLEFIDDHRGGSTETSYPRLTFDGRGLIGQQAATIGGTHMSDQLRDNRAVQLTPIMDVSGRQ
jgi:hypothetical protein